LVNLLYGNGTAVRRYDSELENEAQARVLDYWRAVELFSPQRVPKENPAARINPVVSLKADRPLPWETLLLASGGGDQVWRFTVYAGIFNQARVRWFLYRHFGRDTQSFDRRMSGRSCLFALQITEQGRPLFDTLTIASCAWAIGRMLNPGYASPDWLDGFSELIEEQRHRVEQWWAIEEDDAIGRELRKECRIGRPLDAADILACVDEIAGALGVAGVLRPEGARIAGIRIRKQKKIEPDSHDFLNSFFVEDLKTVAREVRTGNAGAALKSYLKPAELLDEGARVNVRERSDILWDRMVPAMFPVARWPSDSRESLYFSQQFAVNSALCDLRSAGAGLFGVNGPPGTGKTTLLREMVASIVVERARAISRLKSPHEAFQGEEQWKSDHYHRTISLWKDAFRGFEMVVASSNNRAVENVTLEIPAASAIGSEWRGEADYFADFAKRILASGKSSGEAWALVAARFGNKKNRRHFRSNFWFRNEEAGENPSRADLGFSEYLRTLKTRPSTWRDAVRKFKRAVEAEQEIRAGRAEACRLQSEFAECEKAARETKLALDAATNKRARHQRFKPGLVDAVFTAGVSYREWSEEDRRLAAEIDALEQATARARNRFADLEAALRRLRAETLVEREMGHEARELSSPWADEEWNRARTRVFIEALHLHRAFLECVPMRIRSNLWGAMDILSGKVPAGTDLRGVESAWATLFFVVPVVSTTFASFDRLFSHLGREALGWLLIDEAGQASPQAAAGAIWRSKRVVSVGDPRQLEPIVTLPFTAQQALRRHFGVPEMWLPSENSVQSLIDRASKYGTYLESQEDDSSIWVGSPLRVHRRCERPMFDVSNEVAYDGQMVYATPAQAEINLGPSRWLHVASTEAERQWIPDEGLMLEALLSELKREGLSPNDLLLVSPFRAVAERLRQIGKSHGVKKAGTIHVAQGAEADVVILVLGGDPKAPGSKEWASDRPNLLNVAVSRAKRRLYVIGNREEWSQYPYFSDAVRMLSRVKSQGV
jgi:hypothetical protein